MSQLPKMALQNCQPGGAGLSQMLLTVMNLARTR